MTTFAALQDAQRELEALTLAAWTTYGDALRELDGSDYADAEPAAWEQLQATLRDAAEQPSPPAAPSSSDAG
jgi:hypothetical protein